MNLVFFPSGRVLAHERPEFYNVGRTQLSHWINGGSLRPPYYGWYPILGDWLVAYCVAGHVCLAGAYRDYHTAYRSARLDMRAGRLAEVWHVEDDSVLFRFCPVCRRLWYYPFPSHDSYLSDMRICWDCFIDSL